jgi:hypothetical protein
MLGLVWLVQTVVAVGVVALLFRLTLKWSSRGAAATSLILEGLGVIPAIGFLDLIRNAGVPALGLYAFGVAVAAAICIVLLSALELSVSDSIVSSHGVIAVVSIVAIAFVAAAVPRLATAYSSAQIGADGFPVGPVTSQFVEAHGSKLPLLYPGSVIRNTSATGETRTLNRSRLASWGETLQENGRIAEVRAWYRESLEAAGWREISCQGSLCTDGDGIVFARGSRECLVVLVVGDGVGRVDIGYQITPSGKPLSGNTSADLRYCTGQY